jgi:membrane associated rhomboid family serine protease
VGNPFQMLGYAMVTVAGLGIAVSLLSPGFRLENTSVETAATVGALGVSLALSAVWGGRRPAHAAALFVRHHETPAGPQDGAS